MNIRQNYTKFRCRFIQLKVHLTDNPVFFNRKAETPYRKRYCRVGITVMAMILLGFLGPAGSRPAAAAKGAPVLAAPQTVHDFGEITEDQPLTHTFLLENTGDAPLQILDIDPDCKCTAAQYDKKIPPGGQGKITLTIEPYSVMRQFKKNTRVLTNDPERREVTLTLQGVARPIIEIKPTHIVRLQGTPQDNPKFQVRFTSNLPTPWEITDYRTNMAASDVEIEVKTEQPGKVYVVEVRNKRREPGKYTGVIELITTSAKRPRLMLRVFGDIR